MTWYLNTFYFRPSFSAKTVENILQCCILGNRICQSKYITVFFLVYCLCIELVYIIDLAGSILMYQSFTWKRFLRSFLIAEELTFQELDPGIGIWMERNLLIMHFTLGPGPFMMVLQEPQKSFLHNYSLFL